MYFDPVCMLYISTAVDSSISRSDHLFHNCFHLQRINSVGWMFRRASEPFKRQMTKPKPSQLSLENDSYSKCVCFTQVFFLDVDFFMRNE